MSVRLSAFLAASLAGADLATATAAPAQAAGGVPQTTDHAEHHLHRPEPGAGLRHRSRRPPRDDPGQAPRAEEGFDRSQFGPAQLDADGNGCDTRNDMLNRALTDIAYVTSVACTVASGTLADPYTATIAFLRGVGTSDPVQIDHIVALADAWKKGAQQLSYAQRVTRANDPLNLQSTGGPTNEQKGDGDAATWLPPNQAESC